MTMGELTSATWSGYDVMVAAMVLIDNMRKIADAKAAARRILGLHCALDQCDNDKHEAQSKVKHAHLRSSMGSDAASNNCSSVRPVLSANIIEIENVPISTPLTFNKLVQNLNLKISRGMSVMIIGPSGCGKSSLLRAILGLWEPDAGTIKT